MVSPSRRVSNPVTDQREKGTSGLFFSTSGGTYSPAQNEGQTHTHLCRRGRPWAPLCCNHLHARRHTRTRLQQANGPSNHKTVNELQIFPYVHFIV